MSERQQYKYFTENDPDILNRKNIVKKIIQQRGFTSFMNDTKWLKLQEAVKSLPFPPAYIEKIVDHEDEVQTLIPDQNPNYFGDWSPFYEEGMPLFFEVEWMKIIPRYAEHRGQLIAPKIMDESDQFRKILHSNSIYHEESNVVFIIFGYR